MNLRTNLRIQLARSLDVQLNIGYVNSDLRRPQNDNNSYGVVSGLAARQRGGLLAGPGAKLHASLCTGGTDTVSHGYYNPGIEPVRLLQHQHAAERAAAHRRPDEQLDAD